MNVEAVDAVFPTEEIKTILRQGVYKAISLDSIRIVQKPNHKDRATQLFYNPRSTQGFGDEDMAELEASIASKGLMQPIAVREIGDDTYELVWGERRTRALRALVERNQDVYTEGGQMLPASEVYSEVICRVVTDCDDERAIALAWAENDKHVALPESDVLDLCDRLASMGYSRSDIGELLQKQAPWLSHTFGFREKLPPQVYTMLRQGKISRSYAIKLMEQPEELRDDLAKIAEQIAVERYDTQLAEIEAEIEDLEECLVEAETDVALADAAPPEVQQKVRKKLDRVGKLADSMEAREKKFIETGVVRQQGDVDEAVKRKGLVPSGKGLTVKVIYAEYINRADELMKVGKQSSTGKIFSPRDLEIAKLVATGIALGEKDFETMLRGHYDKNNLWDAEEASISRWDGPPWDQPDPEFDEDDEIDDEELEELDIDI